MSLFRAHRIFILAFALLLQACSSGGGETGTGVTPTNGNNVSVGRITAFGSVWVNGVEFDVATSQVKLEGESSATSALKLGMVVTVKGTINANGVSGTADQILVEEVAKGPIDSIDLATNSLIVLGQQVVVNETTLYEAPLVNLGSLSASEFVEVSGIVKSAGVITATRIERKSSLSSYKLKGIVSNTTPSTFTIGTLIVNYASVSSFVPSDGLLVEVKGSLSGGVLVATSVESEALDVADADKFEIEGYAAAMTVSGGVASFTVNNVPVQTSVATAFSAGLITDLADGVFVEVEGALQGGTVVASKVAFREGVKLESYVVGIGTNSFTLDGLSGLTVTVNNETEYGGIIVGFSDIAVSSANRVSVRGRYVSANTVIATRIEVEVSSDPKVVLQGPVDALSNPTLTLMGIGVTTSSSMSFDADGTVDQAGFFTAVSAGDVVNVEGTLSSGVVTWDAIELEN